MRALATVTLCGSLLLTSEASAYDLLTEGNHCPNGFTFPADQQIYLNVSSTGLDTADLYDAMIDVTQRINAVQGQWYDYLSTYAFSAGGYSHQTRDNINPNGLFEVGMANLAGTGAGASGGALVDTETCEVIEADVFFNTQEDWVFGVPADYSDDYFGAGSHVTINGTEERYGRTVLLHELLHTHSLAHSNSSYSFMNADNRPWANRSREKQVEPLPDDRQALRYLYGDGATELDVAALVTWFDPVRGAPADGTLLCMPSTGTTFSAGLFDPTCGVFGYVSGITTVCPGETLYVRVTVVNYGTGAVTIAPELWFSTNDWLDTTAGLDQKSPTVKPGFLAAAESASARGYQFTVPTTLAPNTDYYPIINLNTGLTLPFEDSQQNNWIPLIGTIRVDNAHCP